MSRGIIQDDLNLYQIIANNVPDIDPYLFTGTSDSSLHMARKGRTSEWAGRL